MIGAISHHFESCLIRPLATALLALALFGCAGPGREPPNLYEALGGETGVEALVAAAVEEVHGDPRFGDLFVEADLERLREQLAVQICELADGPCRYEGLDMASAHSGMGITAAEFNWFVEDTRAAMTRIGVPQAARNRLLARLARLQPEVMRDTAIGPAAVEEVDPLGLGD